MQNPFRYTAREFTSETDFYYYRARYYDRAIGRFLSEDPIRFEGELNFFTYVANRPTVFVDPSGRLAELYCERISPFGNGSAGGLAVTLTLAQHCYIRVSCRGLDETIEIYGPAGGDRGRPMRQAFNPNRGGRKFTIYPPPGLKCCEFENRLLQNYERLKTQLPVYDPRGPNSNTFVSLIIYYSGATGDFPLTAFGAYESLEFIPR